MFVANLYKQDFPVKGYFSQATILHNRNRESGRRFEFDKNGFIQRPSSLLEERSARDYDITYLGYNGDGHFDRLNITTSWYLAVGEQDSSRLPGVEEEVMAWFTATELSVDFDWFRPKFSFLYASGDDDTFDLKAKGFDAVFENPQFAGADTSFWIRQNVPFIAAVEFLWLGETEFCPRCGRVKARQSNFINPGIILIGLGADLDLLPELRLSANINHLMFDKVQTLSDLGSSQI